jgi:hypothetical protein
MKKLIISIACLIGFNAQADTYLSCVEPLIDGLSGSISFTVDQVSEENFSITIKESYQDLTGELTNTTRTFNNLECDEPQMKADFEGRIFYFSSLGCSERNYDEDGLKKSFYVSLDEEFSEFRISEITHEYIEGWGEVAVQPRRTYKPLGMHNAFRCDVVPL